jgi:8-oxo-dGTP diphosphatase
MTILATVCAIMRGNRVLLQKKTTGRFGGGKWNGPGGKLRPGETPEECAKREVQEETGLRIRSLTLHGALRHDFGDTEEPDWIVYQFSTSDFEGELMESEEGSLRWFPTKEIPYEEMWQDDVYWLPLLLEGKRFEGEFHFNDDGAELLSHNLIVHE